jgi:hypothetical protein
VAATTKSNVWLLSSTSHIGRSQIYVRTRTKLGTGAIRVRLDLVKDIKEQIERHGTMEDLESLGILEAYYDHPECMGAWLAAGIDPTIRIL